MEPDNRARERLIVGRAILRWSLPSKFCLMEILIEQNIIYCLKNFFCYLMNIRELFFKEFCKRKEEYF